LPPDLLGQDADEHPAELGLRFFGRRNRRVRRIQNLRHGFFEHLPAAIGHVVNAHVERGVALQKRRPLLQREPLQIDANDHVGFHRLADVRVLLPRMLVGPLRNFAIIHNVNLFNLLLQ